MKLNKMDVWIIWEINKHTAEVNLRAIDTSKELADKHKIGMEKMNDLKERQLDELERILLERAKKLWNLR